ncbi:tetratricopeptide repeat protein [Streptomyces sp. NPDC086182]|uniref:ATP-binding protein n=1 Tax=Streptomyces sp. NPDC086182 TaxID=3155058 RepID=UPI0034218E82
MPARDLYLYRQEAPLPTRPVVTCGLPQDVVGFTGRRRELERLLAAAGPGRVANMHTVDGMPGVGKTTLVTHAAHLLAEHFPDGQFFYDLHAHTPDLPSAQPVDVLAVLLTDLGIAPRHLPRSLEGRSHLWRDRLTGKRVLLVLDDAAGHAQIQPLLPAGPGCLTLVTSRRRLIAMDGADPVSLAPLTPDEAAELFTSRSRRDPTDSSEQDAVAETVCLCGYLPLAIVLLAGRLRHKDPVIWSLARFATEFADAQDRLGELDDGDNRAVCTAFTLSYRDLPADQQRLFRRIGLHPGPDIDAYAAAALDDAPLAATRRRLEALYTDHLLDEIAPGRYQPHDLLRAYARTLTTEHDTPDDRAQAVDRLMGYYQRTAQTADQHLARIPRPGDPPAERQATAPDLPDRAAALAWLRTERDNLLACIDTATRQQAPRAVHLTAAIAAFLLQDGPWLQAATLHQRAAATAHRDNDRLGETNALHELGRVRYLTGEYEQATGLQERALGLYEELGHRLGQANALNELGRVRYLTGDYVQATGLQERALALYEELGYRLGQANILHDLGRVRYLADDYEQATRLQERALALYEELGNRHGQANALNDLGRVLYLTGDYEQVIPLQERALALYEELGNRLGQAHALRDLGRVRYTTGDYVQATGLQERALGLYEELGYRLGQANSLHDLGRVRYLADDYEQATRLQERALALYEELGNRHGQAHVLNDLGRVRCLTGDYEPATRPLGQALALFREVGDRQGEAEALNSTGVLLAESTRPQEALAPFRQALELARQIRSPLDEARALEGAAGCHERLGDRAAALAELREAVGIYRRIGAAEAKAAAEQLANLEAEEGSGASGVEDSTAS